MSFKNILIILIVVLSQTSLDAQETASDEKAVHDVIATMFEGMRLGDSTMVSQLFQKDAEFFTVYITPKGHSKMRAGSVLGWLDAIGTPHEQVWNEEWWDPVIHVERNFAHVWTPYAFYVDDTFSHCGVDSFHMIKDDEGKWKVFHATDTRKKEGCDEFIPDYIKAKHANE